MKIVVASAVSLALGLALGWVAFHGDPVVQNVETKTVERVEVPVPGKTVVPEGPSKQPAGAAVPSAPPSTTSAGAPEQEVLALRAKVAELEATLNTELKMRQGTEGEKVPVPAGLAPRLRDEKQLVSAFNAAFQEAGFSGQVTSVDCSEHPCLVFGNGFGARGDLEKLLPTSAFNAYAKDAMSTFGFQRGPDGQDPASRFFGVAVLPSGGEASDELSKRIAFRIRQMEEVSRPPKK